jgi:hypothetical protein
MQWRSRGGVSALSNFKTHSDPEMFVRFFDLSLDCCVSRPSTATLSF